MMQRTPPKKDTLTSMPTGKLCAVTRKRNEIEPLILSAGTPKEYLIKLYGEFLQKVEVLFQVCEEIGQCNPDDSTRVNEWLEPHQTIIKDFGCRLQAYIDHSETAEISSPAELIPTETSEVDHASSTRTRTKLYKSQPIEVQARALSPDRISEISRASSCRSNSSIRIKLAEKKAQLSAEKMYQEKIIKIEETDFKNKMLRKKLELEKQEAETSLFQSELDKLDGIADTIENLADHDLPERNYPESNTIGKEIINNIRENARKDYAQTYKLNVDHRNRLSAENILDNEQEKRELNTPHHTNYNDETYRLPRRSDDIRFNELSQRQSTQERYSHTNPTNSQSFISKAQNNTQIHPSENAFDMNTLTNILQKQNEISLKLIKNQEKTSLPKRELKPFTGKDITEYRRFINMFFMLVHNRCDSSADCLHYLDYYTDCNAREIVRSAFDCDPRVGYEKALAMLEEEYGNELKVANKYIEKLEDWPVIKSEDEKGLNELSLFLMTCESNMANTSVLNQLNSPKLMRSVVMKLPYRLREKWRDSALDLNDNNTSVKFSHLVSFIRRQSRVISQPLFGDIKDSQSYQSRNNRPKVFSILEEKENDMVQSEYIYTNDTPKNTEYSVNSAKNKLNCEFCNKFNHNIKTCTHFSELIYEQKLDFVQRNGLCFSCLNGGHFSRNCKERLACNKCHKFHPTIMHNMEKSPNYHQTYFNQSSTMEQFHPADGFPQKYNFHTGAGDISKVVCPVVPVKIKVSGKMKFISTYAILDNGSSSCFMDSKLLQELGIRGAPSDISLTTMTEGNRKMTTRVVHNLDLYSLEGEKKDCIPVVFAQDIWPFNRKDLPTSNSISDESHLKDLPVRFINSNVGLLIGMNRPEMLKPLEIVSGPINSPYASRHHLGWAINGPLNERSNNDVHCHRVIAKQSCLEEIEREIKTMYKHDFNDSYSISDKVSYNDQKWTNIVQQSICLNKGHFQINLPFKDPFPSLPSNKNQIYYNFLSLKKRLEKDELLFQHYKEFMNMMYERGYMIKVDNKQQGWYLSHHGVLHKEKNKLRVVFNCALKYKDRSLNDMLLQGPDLINNLLGVLLRFREEKVAFIGDIEKMYYQVKVPEHQQDYLRLFWFENSNLNGKITEFKLTVHLFGAISSPAICNFALKQTVNQEPVSNHIKSVIARNFYVDDLLCSVSTDEVALVTLNKTKELLSKTGFNLTQFASNSRYILNAIAPNTIANSFRTINLHSDLLPNERALGLLWDTEKDFLQPKINFTQKALNRRGILSVIHGVYDPLGLISPTIVPAKIIFQETCQLKLDWNDKLPESILCRWQKWMRDLPLLLSFQLPRCVRPYQSERFEIHYFSDGSSKAYGSVAYGRLVGEKISFVSLLLSKSRLTPLNQTALKTIPRIELNAAKLSVTLQQILKKELCSKIDQEYFWTDSSTVLGYIRNEEKRFQRFVSNRVDFIRCNTSPDQWNYVPTQLNPADVISRGTDVKQFVESTTWIDGPEFLRLSSEEWPKEPEIKIQINKDVEVINSCIKVNSADSTLEKLMLSSSNFNKIKYRIAWLIKFKNYLLKRDLSGKLTLAELKQAEIEILKYVQDSAFAEVKILVMVNKSLPKGSPLKKLNPFIKDNILRAGGRLGKSSLPYNTRYPIILPNKHPIVKLIIEDIHKQCGHMGRQVILTYLRKRYWLIGANTFIRTVLNNCLQCRKFQGKPNIQKMADLPIDRVTGSLPPFHTTGIDFFGPYSVTNGRKREKRYGVIFTCLASRAMHLEMSHTLNTDSFINTFRRFVARRGSVRRVRSDNGTNMKAGERELKEAILAWNDSSIDIWMKQKGIEWTFNPPCAPHFGGIWEREIKTIKKVMNSVMNEQHLRLTDENLNTLLCEVECILNSRPLTQITDDPEDLEPLTPNHILLLGNFATFPPGLFSSQELYHNKRWKQVQYLANLFWYRWRREYLPMLQTRQRWQDDKRSLEIGDLVLVVDNLLPRHQWNTGRITKTYPDSKGMVRVVKVKLAKHKHGSITNFGTYELDRPVTKVVLLRSAEELQRSV